MTMEMKSNIGGLICRSCWKVVKADGEHWFGECDDPTVHPGIVEYGLDSESHLDFTLSPSTVLGAMRFEFIRRTMKYYPEAQGFTPTVIGTIVGEGIEKSLLKRGFERQVAAEGELWGERFRTGGSDLVLWGEKDGKKTLDVIINNKFGNEGSLFYAKGRGIVASEEDAAQVNMESMLHAQMGKEGAMDAELWVWRGTVSSALVTKGNKKKNEVVGNFRDQWIKQRAPRMSLEEIGEIRAAGATNRVIDAVRGLTDAFKRFQGGEKAEEILKTLGVNPNGSLVCETRFNETACLAYCGGNRVCMKNAGRRLHDKGIVDVRIPEEV